VDTSWIVSASKALLEIELFILDSIVRHLFFDIQIVIIPDLEVSKCSFSIHNKQTDWLLVKYSRGLNDGISWLVECSMHASK